MGTIQTNVRWADNTKELAANVKQGIDTIDAMRKAVDRTAQSLGGQGLFTAANRATAAIIELGGASKLTAAEQERNLALLDKAIEKYKVLGQTAPTAMRQVATALREQTAASKAAADQTQDHALGIGRLSEALRINIPLAGGLTARFSENASALGALGIGLGTVAVGYEVLKGVFNIAQEIGHQASAIRDLSTATGIGIEPLQILGNATKDFGVTMEEVARGAFQLSRRIAGGDESAAAAIGLLGLNFEKLKAQSPDQQLLTIVRTINQLPESMRAVVATDLFGGKLAQSLLKLGPELDKMIEKVKAAGEFMSEDSVKGADDFSDAIEHLETQFMALLANGLGPTLGKLTDLLTILRNPEFGILAKLLLVSGFPLADSLAAGFAGARSTAGIAPIAPSISHAQQPGMMVSHGTEEAKQAQALENALKSLGATMAPLTKIQKEFLDQAVQMKGAQALVTKEVELGAAMLGISTAQLKAFTKATQDQEQEAKKVQTAIQLVANASASYGATLASIKPQAAAEIQDLMRRGLWLDAMAPKYGVNEAQVKALATQLQVEAHFLEITTGATEGLVSNVDKLGKVDNETIPTLKAKTKAEEELAAALAKRLTIETALAGHVDTHLLPGDPANELGNVKAGLEESEKAAKRTHEVFQLLGDDLGMLGNTSNNTFNKVVHIVQAAIRALEQLLVATLAETTALAAMNFLKGLSIGLSFLAFVNTGGVITPQGGVQHFDRGGMVSPFGGAPNSKDTVPIWAMPGEMFINPQQQARLFHFIDGQVPVAVANGNITENHYHSHNWDLRQAVVTNDQGLQRLSREVAKRNATGVARNQDSINTRGRAGYGLRS